MRHASRSRSAVFAPIGDSGRALRVEQRLADAIRSGLLADGERLPSEPELAAMLGVATVTAREALVALRAQGLVTTVRGRGGGSFVTRPRQSPSGHLTQRLAQMTRTELRDRGTLYRVILTGCAELAAGYAGPDDVDALGRLLVDPASDDIAAWHQSGVEVHLSLAALTQSARMVREVARLEADFGVLMRLPLDEEHFRAGVAASQRELLGALAAGSGSDARACVQDQIGEAMNHLAEIQSTLGA